MQKIIMGILFLFLIYSCSSEKINGQKENQDSLSTSQPQTKIIVNKEFDDKGNLVKFDSSYSYYYSNMENDSTFRDTVYHSFQNKFFNSLPNIQRPFLEDMFFEDSLLTYDFYKDDFFSKRFQFNNKRFEKLFEKMDSVKNKFYNKLSQPPK